MLFCELKKEEKDKVNDLFKHYRHVCLCKKCVVPYGYDTDTDNGLCPSCIDKKIKEGKKKNLKAKRK